MKQSKHIIIQTGLLFIISILIMTSCRKEGDVNTVMFYKIANHSSYKIKVISNNYWEGHYGTGYTKDTVFHYDPGESRDLFVVYGLSTNTNPETSDTLRGIGKLLIYKNDTIPTLYNYRETRFWTYSEPDRSKRVLLLEITDASFKP
jgi:hypothetical protein